MGGGPPNYPPQPGYPNQQYGQQQQQQQQPGGQPQYRPGGMAEADANARSKAQLIVGIDFVSSYCLIQLSACALTFRPS